MGDDGSWLYALSTEFDSKAWRTARALMLGEPMLPLLCSKVSEVLLSIEPMPLSYGRGRGRLGRQHIGLNCASNVGVSLYSIVPQMLEYHIIMFNCASFMLILWLA
ncbi:hypothetical protein KSP39_PZI009461 [Platanthera zijinensis]|uniref:Uncharacterized protein n=1 Tax=Platanthera zijinensis TaxID=2320716 RepID=A0AAP0BK28_9ASPA